MSTRLQVGTIAAITLLATATVAYHRPESPEVVAHEWGTFTSVAGQDGRAINWVPLGGSADLPCFVKHLQGLSLASPFPATSTPVPTPPPSDPTRIRPTNTYPITKGEVFVGVRVAAGPVNFETARANIWGKVRMETPVIYFYSPSDVDALVTVRFPRGLMTEFYPTPDGAGVPFNTAVLNDPNHVHSLHWSVKISPSIPEQFLTEPGASHYYAARATDATPIRVNNQTEKFIFYRGIANFDVPIETQLVANDRLEIRNVGAGGAIPVAILFESRGGKMGFTVAEKIEKSAVIERPKLDRDQVSLRAELHKELVSAGLFPKEAAAMIETWRDSWFEDGARVFYILPQRSVNSILPLSISPAPASVQRVFVGRMEIIDPTTVGIVREALDQNDTATLARYGRFLHPIADQIIARGADAATAQAITNKRNAFYSKYTSQLHACQ